MKYYIIAGEPSGDLHASFLMKELKIVDKDAEFRFFGGDLMKEQGGFLVKHYKELAFMGVWEVLKNIRTIKKNFEICKNDILNWKPNAVILVDYPGFNLKMANFIHNLGIKTFYYISPKVWAWKEGRVKTIKKVIDKLFVIFPFEVEFYKKHNYHTEYLGNPTVEIVYNELSKQFEKQNFLNSNKLGNKEVIALLPGSRLQEVTKMLPIYKRISEKFKDFQFVVAGVNSLPVNIYNDIINNSDLKIVYNKTYDLLKVAKAAIVTSGTATLETALFNVPQIVCYKTSGFTYLIGSIILRIKFISLVNILLNKKAVIEIIQNKMDEKIILELNNILYNEEYRNCMLNNYKNLSELLGENGSPLRTASKIYEKLIG